MDEHSLGREGEQEQPFTKERACNELSAALGWPTGISAPPLTWEELLRVVATYRMAHSNK